jgi:hypothetical protein
VKHPGEGSGGGGKSKSAIQVRATIWLLVTFAALSVAMMALADTADIVWQRRLYVFSAVEAIVFTAVGWLFGREVHRASVESAREDAVSAQDETRVARHEATLAAQSAMKTQARAAALKAALRALDENASEAHDAAYRGSRELNIRQLIEELLPD